MEDSIATGLPKELGSYSNNSLHLGRVSKFNKPSTISKAITEINRSGIHVGNNIPDCVGLSTIIEQMINSFQV